MKVLSRYFYPFATGQPIGLDDKRVHCLQVLSDAFRPSKDAVFQISRNTVLGQQFSREGFARLQLREPLRGTYGGNTELAKLIHDSGGKRLLWPDQDKVWIDFTYDFRNLVPVVGLDLNDLLGLRGKSRIVYFRQDVQINRARAVVQRLGHHVQAP